MKGLRALVTLCALIVAGCGDGGIQSPDFTPVLQSVNVEPATSVVSAGLTEQFTAVGVYTRPPGSSPATETRPLEDVSWSSSNTSRATIDENGLATAISQGTVTITASAEGVEGSATLTVGAPVLQSLAVTPGTSTVAVDGTQSLTATGTFSDGSTNEVPATWTSGNTGVATVTAGPAETTTVTGVSVGSSVVTATAEADNSIRGTATVTVRSRVISLTIVPDSGSSPLGRPFQYNATGTIKTGPATTTTGGTVDGSLSGIVWSVANALSETNPAPVAIVDEDLGIVTGVRVGNAVVTAAVDGVTDTATFAATPAVLETLSISPENPSLAAGTSVVLTANGVFSDGGVQPVAAQWTLPESSVPDVVSFDPASGSTSEVTGLVVGTGTIRATAVDNAAISDETGVTVTNAVLQGVAGIDPPSAAINPGRSVEFVLQGQYSDGVTRNIDDSLVTWTSSATDVATIAADGVATGVAEGQSTITATTAGFDPQTALLTVTESACTTPLLASDGAQVEGIATGLCVGCSLNNGARVIDASAETFGTLSVPVGLTAGATMSAAVSAADNPNYTLPFAAGSNAGFIIARPVGGLALAELLTQLRVSTLVDGTVSETSGDFIPLRVDLLGQAIIDGEVTDAVLVSIRSSVAYNGVQLTFVSGAVSALTGVQVFQACGTVTPPVQQNLVGLSRIEPVEATVIAGQARNFVAYGVLENGEEVEIADADLDWSSSNEAVATVDANGLLTGVAGGTATITATLKPTVVASGSVRSAVSNVTVIEGACTTRFLASEGATVDSDVSGLCLFCNVANEPNVIDGQLQTSATVTVPVDLLGGSVSVTVQLPSAADDLEAGQFTGFVLGRPAGNVLLAELGSSLQVSTLLNGSVQESTGTTIPLRLGLLGQELTGGNALILAGLPTTQPYDGIRLTFNGGLATLLSNVLVFDACAVADPDAVVVPEE